MTFLKQRNTAVLNTMVLHETVVS